MADTEPPTDFDPSDLGNDSFSFTTLRAQDRADLVKLTDVRNARQSSAFLNISTLELSALGANADIAGDWDAPLLSNVAAWRDLGQGGRTVKSLISARGYMFPLGHRAIITKHFDRVFALDPSNSSNKNTTNDFPVAYLQTHTVLHISEPVKTYGPGTEGEPYTNAGFEGATDWPFAKVRMITLRSPDLDVGPDLRYVLNPNTHSASYQQAIWPTFSSNVSGHDVQWTFVATDLAGNEITFTMPLIFAYAEDPPAGETNGNEKTDGSPNNSDPENEFDIHGSTNWTNELVTAYLATPPARYQKTSKLIVDTGVNYSATGGRPLLFAPEVGPAGTSTHPVLSILLGAATSTTDINGPADSQPQSPGIGNLRMAQQPNFYPTIAVAKIRVHAAEVLTGQDQDQTLADDPLPIAGGIAFQYYPDYVAGDLATFGQSPAGGATSNQGAVWAQSYTPKNTSKTLAPMSLTLPANTVGGIGTPNTSIAGLSALAGTVGGDISSFANKAPFTDISECFDLGSLPQLLGGLKFTDILDAAGFSMPNISSQTLPNPYSLLGSDATADDVTTGTDPATGAHTVTYTFSTTLASGPAGLDIFVPGPNNDPDNVSGMLNMTAVVSATPNGSAPTYKVNGSIDPFTINLVQDSGPLQILIMTFDGLTFSSGSGQGTNVDVMLNNVTFGGCLEFVNTLEQFLDSLGAGGLGITVTPTQVVLGMSFSLPDQQTGVFSLCGISFAVGVKVPFLNGKAVATFGFASQDNPFTMTYCCFGGGGFVSLGVGFGGVQTLQAQFEVEFSAGIGIEVASGSVSLSVGIYFSYTSGTGPGTGPDLSGFVQLSGQVEILGILTISLVMNVSLTWEIEAGAVQGTATMRVGVSICGFGTSVPVTITKSFGGSSAPAMGQGSNASPQNAADFIVGKPPPGGAIPPVGDDNPNPPTLAPPKFIDTPITFSDLIAQDDWDTYCAAFSA